MRRTWPGHLGSAPEIQRFLGQPFHVAEVFTNTPGKYVKLEDTIRGFKMILAGELDHVPEPYFNFKGGIEEVLAHFDRDSSKGK